MTRYFIGTNVEPDRQEKAPALLHLEVGERLHLRPRPVLGEKGRAQNDNSKLRATEAIVDSIYEGVADPKFPFVVPDRYAALAERLRERTDEAGLVLAGVRDEDIVRVVLGHGRRV